MSIRYLIRGIAATALATIALAGPASAALIATSDLAITDDDLAGSVGYLSFTVATAGTFNIEALGSLTLGSAYNFDPAAYLFVDDGSLDAGDLVIGNNSGAFDDVFFSETLGVGNYLLAVSEFSLLLSEAISGINGGNSIQDPNKFIRVNVFSVQSVPEPYSLSLVGIAFAGLLLSQRKRPKS